MILLAADTSGKQGSISLARVRDRTSAQGTSAHVEILEVVPLAGGTFSAQLVPQISALLTKHGMGKQEVDGFSVASGPGSFTGLRVGLAAIKALAEVLGKPIASVSLLEAAAYDLMLSGRTMSEEREPISPIVIAFDASRSEVFLGEYEVTAMLPQRMKEALAPLGELARLANQWGRGRAIFTPDLGVWEYMRANIEDPSLFNVYSTDRPNAASVARLGALKLQSGETTSPEELEANYIRRSDAEIFAKNS